MRWAIGLFIGFLVMLGVNGFMVYKALQHAPEIVQSYDAETR